MAAKKVGTLIKEARTNAGLTQEELARKVKDLSASDISLAERSKKVLTQAQLKQIAKITGITQSSLLNAAKGTKSGTARSSSTKKSSSKSSIQVSATEKKLVELYRKADPEAKKAALNVLKGEDTSESLLDDILEAVQDIFEGK